MKLHKVTSSSKSPHGRWYGDACGTAFAMELVGERWSLMIVRELMFGPCRFSVLRARLPGISAKVLTERLASLEQAGAIRRDKLPPPLGAQVYGLTAWGQAAEPAIQELGRWAAKHSGHDPMLPLSPVSLMLSMRTMFDPARADGLQARIGFDVGGEGFLATLSPSELAITRGDADAGQAVFRTPDASILAGVLYAGAPVGELEQGGELVIAGDRDLALRYAALFDLPEKLA